MIGPFRPRPGRWQVSQWALALLAGAALAMALAAPRLLPRPDESAELANRAARAERTFRAAAEHLRQAKEAAGLPPLPGVPSAERGLIGAELTPLVTTLGSLEAKRLAASPAWAATLTRRLARAGVGEGDLVAAGLSGSFPGLNLALATACSSLGARLLAVSSATASTWGATEPGFTWPEMEARLVAAGLIQKASVAVAIGGNDDRAADLEPEARTAAHAIASSAAAALGVEMLEPSSLEHAVTIRMAAYRRHADGSPIVLYVNSGGSHASLGEGAAVLRLRAGFLAPFAFDLGPERGVMARFAASGVPVLHLLNVQDLALRWGIVTGRPA